MKIVIVIVIVIVFNEIVIVIVWLRTSFNPGDIHRFPSHTGKLILLDRKDSNDNEGYMPVVKR